MFPAGYIFDNTYRVEYLLGRGGTASVYVVSHIRLPRRFALKIITSPHLLDDDFMQRFRREAEILASMEHPHVIHVNDWNTTAEGHPYLIMELLTGEDLAHFLARTGPLNHNITMQIFTQVADALQAAHAVGIVHRDLKPANIFLCKNGPFQNYVKVLDFGIAKVLRGGSPVQTERSSIMGTPAYMAPEQARGAVDEIDERTDQFSLATIFYEMLTGRQAFHKSGEDMIQTLLRVLTEEPAPLPDPALDAIIRRAMSKSRDARYTSVSAFVEALAAWAPGEPGSLHMRTERVSSSSILSVLAQAAPPAEPPAVTPPAPETPPPAEPPRAPARLERRRAMRAASTVATVFALSLLIVGAAYLLVQARTSAASQVPLRDLSPPAPAPMEPAPLPPPVVPVDLGPADAAPLSLALRPGKMESPAGVIRSSPPAPPQHHAVEPPSPQPPRPPPLHRPRRRYEVRVTLPLGHVNHRDFIEQCVKKLLDAGSDRVPCREIQLSRSTYLRVASAGCPDFFTLSLNSCLRNLPDVPGIELPREATVQLVESK